MKKIKIIIPVVSCLLVTALFSCANNNEQPESDYYTISIANGHKSPKVLIEGSNLIKKGEACDVSIRVEPFTYLEEIDDYPGETVRICQANRIGYDIALDKKCYTFKKTDEDPCLYKLHINKEYMTTSYVVDINSKFVQGYDEVNSIKFADGALKDKAEITVVNTAVNYDLAFFVTPKNFQSGFTFDGATKDAIEIKGINSTYPEGYPLTPSRKELVLCDSPIQGIGHYQTLAKQLRIAIPMEQLYEVDTSPESEYGYKQKYDLIQISSSLDNPVVYNSADYEKIFNPVADPESCELASAPSITVEDNGIHYNATFAPKSGYKFSALIDENSFPITDLDVLPGTYTPTGHPYFRAFEVHSDPSKRKNIDISPCDAYNGNETISPVIIPGIETRILEDAIGNVYVPMSYWVDFSLDAGKLKVNFNISNMVKYIEFPITTTITLFDILSYKDEGHFYEFYQDGSIDFVQSFNFTIKAIKQ